MIWKAVRGRLSTIVGSASGGLGTFGTLHNVCHYTCEGLVTGLALVGIGVTGLPLAFLEDPRLIAGFGAVGVVSLGATLALRLRAQPASRWWRRLGLRGGVALAFLLASLWSVTHATTRLAGSAAAQDAPTKKATEGGVEVELTLLNLKEASLRDGLVFAIAMNSMDMAAPSFQTYDLKRAITLEVDGRGPLSPAVVQVSDWGHMGHHARGELTFPVRVDEARGRVLRVRIRGIGGIQRMALEWRMPRAR